MKKFLAVILALTAITAAGCSKAPEDVASPINNETADYASIDPDNEEMEEATVNTSAIPAASGDVTTKKSTKITEAEAKAIAYKDAGIKASQAELVKVKTDYENGVQVYEIDFHVGSTEYEYEIAVKTGKIISKSKEIDDDYVTTTVTTAKKTTKITEAQAKAIAYKDAGIKASQAERVTVKTDYENGVQVYEIDFHVGSTEYEYEIAVKTGKILSKSKEIDDDYVTTTVTTAKKSTKITEAQAKAIAYKDAGIKSSQAERVTVKTDYENGVQVYEIEFHVGSTEYEYEIAVKTGKILSKSKEIDDDYVTTTVTTAKKSTKITEAQAKAIAYKDAGIKASQAELVKVKTDYENGVQVYEIEFHVGSTEYEYEIAVKTGKILSKSKEIDDDYVTTTVTTAKKSTKITEAQAKAIAYKDAGIKSSQAERVTVKTDYEDGVQVYEIDFHVGSTEYEYEIAVKTGKILSKSKEIDD